MKKWKLLATLAVVLQAGLVVVACESTTDTNEPGLEVALNTLPPGVVGCTSASRIKQSTDGITIFVTGTRGPDDIDCTAADMRVNVSAGRGNDVVTGSRFDDVVTAGDGDDVVLGGAGADDLSGGNGCDRLEGGDGDDVELDGGPDNDNDGCSFTQGPGGVFGGAGDDLLNGGRGDDDLDGGVDTDVCNGGKGADTFTACETQNDPDL